MNLKRFLWAMCILAFLTLQVFLFLLMRTISLERHLWSQSGDFTYMIIDGSFIEKTAGHVGLRAGWLFGVASPVAIMGYAGGGGVFNIPAMLDGHPVISVGPMAFYGRSDLSNIVIPEGVASVGDYAFSGCTGLMSVTIPVSVKSIGDYAFAECRNLDGLKIPEGVSSVGRMVFHGCANLADVAVPKSLASVGDGMFHECVGLTSVTIPDGVASIGEKAFYGCVGLTGLTIPSSVANIGPYAFCGCAGLSSVVIPASVTRIGGGAFSFCDGLTDMAIPSGVADIGVWAFGRCSNLKAIIVAADNPGYNSLNGVLFDNRQTKLIQYPPGRAGAYTIPAGVAVIGNLAFGDCAGLTSVTIPASVVSVRDRAFYRCYALDDATFLGDAPDMGDYVFEETSKSFVVYHVQGKTGWVNPWQEYPTMPLSDSKQSGCGKSKDIGDGLHQ